MVFKQMCALMISVAIPCSVITSCQSSNLQQMATGEPDKVLKGALSNGFSYYIANNSYDTNKASLRLVVKVGSVLEEEDERGLAHFLEHMVFRGTESFSDGEVIEYLESIGAAFGADANASTGYDETVYMFDLPLDKENSLEKSISILSEFADKALLSEEKLNLEKKVVLDELRVRDSNVNGRSSKHMLKTFLEGTPYSARHPSGLEEVVAGCTPEKIRNFYKKWYRPENMALVAVGDFDQQQVLSFVERYFGNMEKSDEREEIKLISIQDFTESSVKIYEDSEAVASYFVFGNWLEAKPLLTKEDLKQELLSNLIWMMGNRRLNIRSQEESSPFQMAFIGAIRWNRASQLFISQCICWDDHPMTGLQELMVEYEKMREGEFTAKELQIAIQNMKVGLKAALENKDKRKNTEYTDQYMMQFLDKKSPLSFEEEIALNLELLDEVLLEEINAHKELIFNKTERLTCFYPAASSAKISEEEILACIAERPTLEQQVADDGRLEFDVTPKAIPGSIIEKSSYETSGVQKLVLSNGMQVYLHKTDLKQNLFSMTLEACGGLFSYDESLFPSAVSACSYLMRSGLAGLSTTDLQDALVGKHVTINYGISGDTREVQVGSTNEDMEVAFKLVHALFTNRTYRQEAWQQQMKMMDQWLAVKVSNPDHQFMEDVRLFCTNNHYSAKSYGSDSMSKESAEEILGEAFSNPSDYTLVVVGDYDETYLISCLEKYIASLPHSERPFPDRKTNEFVFPAGKHQLDWKYPSVGKEVSMYWSSPIKPFSLAGSDCDFYHIALAKQIIQTRLLKSLRMKEGETYGVQVRSWFPFTPSKASGQCIITFSSSIEATPTMKALLFSELQQILITLPTLEEIKNAEEIEKHRVAKELQTNEGRAQKILEHKMFDHSPDHFFDIQPFSVDPKELHLVMQSLINLDNYSLHLKYPE